MAKYDLEVIRHSTAHLMVHAIQKLFPNEPIELGIGPVIENGFYYDIDMERKILDEDLPKIEEKMKELIKAKIPIERKSFASKEEAIEFFKKDKQELKVELIQDLPNGEEISYYIQDDFVDLCRGPHVENTSHIPMFFKLMNTAGAYWRGDSDRKMLQRIYASSFDNKKELKAHLKFLEEAKKRDHRKLGKDLNLFVFDPSTPASPFFLPKGAFVYNELISFVRRVLTKYDYHEIITPQILDVELWKTSGHYENYKENMYFTNIDQREFAVKPMNCPCHVIAYAHQKFSYRDLPLRYADFGRIHRYEKSGTLAGLTRVRSFSQDDGHIFLEMDSIQDEISSLIKMYFEVYDHFGFTDAKIFLATRPEKKVGDDSTWDKAEDALKHALDKSGRPYQINEGDGSFYGPKIDFQVADAIGRGHQLGTIQLDFQMPERFKLKYTTKAGEVGQPVLIHRAMLGSLERFFGVFLEHVAGAFPFWLAPEQATIVPVNNDAHIKYCDELQRTLKKAGFRVKVDDRNESMGRKTREIQTGKIPFMMVVGDREIENKSVSLRKYGEKHSTSITVDDLLIKFSDLNKEKIIASERG